MQLWYQKTAMLRITFRALGFLVGVALSGVVADAFPSRTRGFVGARWGEEAETAREVARVLGAAPADPAAPGRFPSVWIHGGDALPESLTPAAVASLSNHIASGHGLLLTGSAVTLVDALGLDKLTTKPVTFGDDRSQAGLVPAEPGASAFREIESERGVVWMSNAVYPAFAHLAGPRGHVLARTPGGPENPMLEYRLGRGRVIVLGWRLSRLYFHAPAGCRARFGRLLRNTLADLGGEAMSAPPSADPARPTQRSALHASRNAGDGGPGSVPAVSAAEWESLALAIDDLRATFGARYPRGEEFCRRLDGLRAAGCDAAAFRALRDEALLANPLLDFDRLLLVKRGAGKLGLPMNYQGNSSLDPAGYDNEIAVLSPVRPDGALSTLHRPEGGRFVGDVDLHFDADRLLFSTTVAGGRWRIFEAGTNGAVPRQVPLIDEADVDNYDACYLPDGRIIFTSTAPFTGVPCVRGSAHVANLYLRGTDGRIRRLTVEQDHDWCPTVLSDGRVLYQRWEYADLPHAFSRILLHMNPDGTGQMEYYGSNSYWPASMFYAKPLPGRPSRFVAIVGGHHEQPRMGDLVLFDIARGRFETEGAVQRIPGRGRPVEPIALDLPIAQTWPKFLHPHPLGDPSTSLGAGKYFLVSCQPSAGAPWGIWLADVFDNLVPIREQPGYALLEPVPLRAVPRPPVITDRVDTNGTDAEVMLADVYAGPGLRGIARGTIKALRIFTYHFAYQGMGGEPDAPGLDGPWDVKRVLGTVPVREDGSARFLVPAYMPVSIQPLDADGQALQLMRSWLTAMPGETLSCVGCHEPQNTASPARATLAAAHPAAPIRPWYGPPRGFDFRREVQPVLDRWCIGCHGSTGLATGSGTSRVEGVAIPDLTDRPPVPVQDNKNAYNLASRFTPSYYALRRLVRTPTRESDMRVLPPGEFHAATTRLVQMLRKGHHGVALDAEAWDRLITWIDLGAPAHGTWTDICGPERVQAQAARRREMRRRYEGIDEDPEAVIQGDGLRSSVAGGGLSRRSQAKPDDPGGPALRSTRSAGLDAAGYSGQRVLDPWSAVSRPLLGGAETRTVDLGGGISLDLVRIPAGEFMMGQGDGAADERPCAVVKIARDVWMGRCEVSNEQFARFDAAHESGIEFGDYIHFSPGERGWSLSRPRQPVVRVTWHRARAFCEWLSAKTGSRFRLPSEAEWEYACRAGTATPFGYGSADADFSHVANLSDRTHQAIDPFGWAGRPQVIPPWRPADTRFDDHARVAVTAGSFEANLWGLHDMHGNVAEWTGTAYRPYPYAAADGRESPGPGDLIVARGGSWYDVPARARSAFRQPYAPDRPVYDVGFRVVCEE